MTYIDTLQSINDKYYKQNPNHHPHDDNEGHLKIVPGEKLSDRYEVKHKSGKGSFGIVVIAYDHVEKAEVAIKIVNSKKHFTKQAQIEINNLRKFHNCPFISF